VLIVGSNTQDPADWLELNPINGPAGTVARQAMFEPSAQNRYETLADLAAARATEERDVPSMRSRMTILM
jgi:hypothetical protein